jgi:hypothetical protein
MLHAYTYRATFQYKQKLKSLLFYYYAVFDKDYVEKNIDTLLDLAPKELNIIKFVELQNYNNRHLYNDNVLDYLAKKKYDNRVAS